MASNTFKLTPWSVSIDSAEKHAVSTEDGIKGLDFGLFDDSFMHKDHEIGSKDGYNEELWIALDGISGRWKNSPCGGEISYYASKDQKEFLRPETGIYGISWEAAAAKYHMTYVIGNDCVEGVYGTADRVKEASQNSGYQFTVTAFNVSETEAHVEVKNTGIAPCYFDVYPTVNGTRSDMSLKGLLPGESVTCDVANLSISQEETPVLTITGDKLYPNETVPYNANLTATSVQTVDVAGNDASFSIKGGRLTVHQSTPGEIVVTGANGCVIYRNVATDADIMLPQKGVYIIQIQGKSHKIAL